MTFWPFIFYHALAMKKLSLFLLILMTLPSPGAQPKKLVIIGDSITEGYGVSREEAYPALLQKKIIKAGQNWLVVNSGISGSTSASAASRVTWHLKQKPDLIIIALGANDGLRGLPVKSIENNLNAAVELCQKAKVKVILAGIKVPPNYGADYFRQFEGVFANVARKYSIPLIPNLIDSVGGEKALNQADGIHPNAKGHPIIAATVYKAVKKFL